MSSFGDCEILAQGVVNLLVRDKVVPLWKALESERQLTGKVVKRTIDNTDTSVTNPSYGILIFDASTEELIIDYLLTSSTTYTPTKGLFVHFSSDLCHSFASSSRHHFVSTKCLTESDSHILTMASACPSQFGLTFNCPRVFDLFDKAIKLAILNSSGKVGRPVGHISDSESSTGSVQASDGEENYLLMQRSRRQSYDSLHSGRRMTLSNSDSLRRYRRRSAYQHVDVDSHQYDKNSAAQINKPVPQTQELAREKETRDKRNVTVLPTSRLADEIDVVVPNRKNASTPTQRRRYEYVPAVSFPTTVPVSASGSSTSRNSSPSVFQRFFRNKSADNADEGNGGGNKSRKTKKSKKKKDKKVVAGKDSLLQISGTVSAAAVNNNYETTPSAVIWPKGGPPISHQPPPLPKTGGTKTGRSLLSRFSITAKFHHDRVTAFQAENDYNKLELKGHHQNGKSMQALAGLNSNVMSPSNGYSPMGPSSTRPRQTEMYH